MRSPRSLIQTIGRAARNLNGRVIMYADSITPAMKQAMEETGRRRVVQAAYNEEHGIIPQTVIRAVMNINPASGTIDYFNVPKIAKGDRAKDGAAGRAADIDERIAAMRLEMFSAAEELQFEKAARMRDELKKLEAVAGRETAEGAPAAFDPYIAGTRKAAARGRGTAKAGAGGASRPGRRFKAR